MFRIWFIGFSRLKNLHKSEVRDFIFYWTHLCFWIVMLVTSDWVNVLRQYIYTYGCRFGVECILWMTENIYIHMDWSRLDVECILWLSWNIYIYVCGCRQDENCRLCLYEMQMWTCDCRLDWVYVILKYDCVLVNWETLWLYSLIDWRISMLLTDIGLKWDKLTVRTLSERTLYFEVTERWYEWIEGKNC